MNRYETSTPRAAFGLAAIALTALTLGLTVVLPARTDIGAQDASVLAASKATLSDVEAVDLPTRVKRIDVIAVREPKLTSMQLRDIQQRRKQQI